MHAFSGFSGVFISLPRNEVLQIVCNLSRLVGRRSGSLVQEVRQDLTRLRLDGEGRVRSERRLARVYLDERGAALQSFVRQRGGGIDEARRPDREEHVTP